MFVSSRLRKDFISFHFISLEYSISYTEVWVGKHWQSLLEAFGPMGSQSSLDSPELWRLFPNALLAEATPPYPSPISNILVKKLTTAVTGGAILHWRQYTPHPRTVVLYWSLVWEMSSIDSCDRPLFVSVDWTIDSLKRHSL